MVKPMPASVIGLLALAGCQSQPTEGDARKWFSEQRPAIDALEKRVLTAMEDFPHAGPELTCEEIIAADPHKGLPGNMGVEVEQVDPSTRCGNAKSNWHQRASAQEKAWRPKVGKVLLDEKRIAGVEIRIARTEPYLPGDREMFAAGGAMGATWSAGCGSASLPGRPERPPEDGINVEGYQLGWGLANLSFSGGGGDSYRNDRNYPSLVVHRAVALRRVSVEIRMALLATEDLPAQYLELQKKRCD